MPIPTRSVSGWRGAERLPAPQLSLYRVLVALVPLPGVLVFPAGVLFGAGEGGAALGCLRCLYVLAGGFFLNSSYCTGKFRNLIFF